MSIKKSNSAIDILEKLKKIYKFDNDSQLARFLGIRPNTLSTWKSRDTIDYKLIIAKCNEVSLSWLFSGEGPIYLSDIEANISSETRIDLDDIRELIEVVEAVFEKNDLYLPPKKKAELITLLYEVYILEEKDIKKTEKKVLQMVKLAS